MTFTDVLTEPSDRQKILDYIDQIEKEFPYKISGQRETFCQYNEAWCDALDRVRSFVESM